MPPSPISPELMAAAAPAPAAPGGAGGAPAGGPMSTPQPKAGLEQAARINVEMTVKLLEQSMGAFPMESEEKKALMSAHSALVKGFGKSSEKSNELIPAEMAQLMQSMPGAGMPGKAPGAMMPGKPAMPPGMA